MTGFQPVICFLWELAASAVGRAALLLRITPAGRRQLRYFTGGTKSGMSRGLDFHCGLRFSRKAVIPSPASG